MNGVLSTIGEAAGLKPTDHVIALSQVSVGKAKAMAYCQAYLMTASPDLRHVFSTHLRDALAEVERYMVLLEKKDWFPVHAALDGQVRAAVEFALPALQ